MRSRNLLIVFVFLMLGVIGVLYVVSRSAQKAAATPKTFVFARAADAVKLDPADVEDTAGIQVLNSVCEGLVRFKSGTMQVEGCLAESWSVSADGCLIIFAMREGVKFHDGTPLTAETAAWSFRRQMDPQAPGHFAGARFGMWRALYGDIEEVRPLDARRLQLRLKRANPAMLANLAIWPAYLISPKSLADHGEGLQRHPVGTGPFKFKEWVPGDRIELVANEEYWDTKKKRLKLGRVVFKVVPDTALRLAQMQGAHATVHAMDGVDPATLPIIAADAGLRLEQAPGLNLAYLAFNCRKGPMTNLMLRRAVAMAIEKRKWVEEVYHGAAVEAVSVLPAAVASNVIAAVAQTTSRPVEDGLTATADEPRLDIETARGLVSQMEIVVRTVRIATNDLFGLPTTIETNVVERVELPPLKLHVMKDALPCLPDPARAAELIKASLKEIGLKTEIIAGGPAAHFVAVRNGEHDLALGGWVSANGDAEGFLSIVDPGVARPSGVAGGPVSDDTDVVEGLAAARSELDLKKRTRLYGRVLALVRERVLLLPLAHAMDMVVLRGGVRGFVLQPSRELRLTPVSVR